MLVSISGNFVRAKRAAREAQEAQAQPAPVSSFFLTSPLLLVYCIISDNMQTNYRTYCN